MSNPTPIMTGIEVLLEDGHPEPTNLPFGLLAHQASVDSRLQHTKDLLFQRFPDRFKCLFSPQHGFRGEKQDNMVVSNHYTDPSTGLPVISLYGERPEPSPQTFKDLELLIIDLQDVGTRVYTFIHTTALAMKACKEAGVKVMVLDRPNPIGGLQVEGNVLKPEMSSLVGLYPIPMRHGLTVGEMARLCNHHFRIGADLEVIPMRGWKRYMYFPHTGLFFVPPSPNMPWWETALVYPGQVLWEGTNVSEGRGTTRPFELFGAPFIDARELEKAFSRRRLKGAVLREAAFEPTFGKWQGQLCHGFQIHVTDPRQYQPYLFSLGLLQDVLRLYPSSFRWKQPPYEYDYQRLPIDLIMGDSTLRQAVEAGEDLQELKERWEGDLKEFREIRREYLLYPED